MTESLPSPPEGTPGFNVDSERRKLPTREGLRQAYNDAVAQGTLVDNGRRIGSDTIYRFPHEDSIGFVIVGSSVERIPSPPYKSHVPERIIFNDYHLLFNKAEFLAFILGTKDKEFDDLLPRIAR